MNRLWPVCCLLFLPLLAHPAGAQTTHTLTYVAGSHGTLSGVTQQTVEEGSDGTPVTALPDDGYYFAGWSDGSQANPRLDTQVASDITVTAAFEPNILTVSADPEGSAVIDVTPDPDAVTPFERSFTAGTSVTLTAPLAQGALLFLRWRLDGTDQPAGQVGLAIAMNSPHEAQAVYITIGNRIYVDDTATGANNGSNWTDAFADLQDALGLARAHGGAVFPEIWVAEGTYRPAGPNGDRALSFDLVNGVSVYGGFAGTESSLDERDLEAGHTTTLSGDLDGNDGGNLTFIEENSYHVVTAHDVTASPALDGVTVFGGNANETGNASVGGGIHISGGSLTLRNCSVLSNTTGNAAGGGRTHGGGGVWILSGTLEIDSSQITGNRTGNGLSATAGGYGGGIYAESAHLLIYNSSISNNSTGNGTGLGDYAGPGGYGGGAYCYVCPEVILDNCTISGNRTGAGGSSDYYPSHGGRGAGACLEGSTATIENCFVNANRTGDSGYSPIWTSMGGTGGGIHADSSTLFVRSSSITQNGCGNGANESYIYISSAGSGGSGGGLYCASTSGYIAESTISQNMAGNGGYAVRTGDGGNGGSGGGIEFGAPFEVRNCVISDNRAGDGRSGSTNRWAGKGGDGGGAFTDSSTIRNCVIVNNSVGQSGSSGIPPSSAPSGGGVYTSSSATFSNSILWGNVGSVGSTTEAAQVSGPWTIDYSCIEGWTGALGGTGNMGEDPQFRPGDTKYHLQSTTDGDAVHSPCIDAGDPADSYDNEPIPNGSRINMGAYGNTSEAERSLLDVRATRSFRYFKYASPGTEDVSVTITNSGAVVTALKLQETVPAGWTFVSVVSPNPPAAPAPGATGTLEFNWASVPAFPVTLAYRLNVPAGETGDKAFAGQVVYQSGGIDLTPIVGPLKTISQRVGHASDYNPADGAVGLSELLRLIQFYNSGGYHVDASTTDGYAPAAGSHNGAPHDADYNPQNWKIELPELLRVIQFYNSGGYHVQEGTADGFAPGS